MLDIQQELEKYKILDSEGNSVYDFYQMLQIRKGLETGVDISQYTALNKKGEPEYSWKQTQEIREKLEEELKAKNNTLIPEEDEKMSL